MIFILISVCFSVFVSVLLKLAKRYDIDNRQAIAWNYTVAGLLTWLIYRPEIPVMNESIYPVYLILGFLLPSLFVILALSIRYTGIVRTDIAQRLSLFIPVIASFVLCYEEQSTLKIMGIAIAFLALVFCQVDSEFCLQIHEKMQCDHFCSLVPETPLHSLQYLKH